MKVSAFDLDGTLLSENSSFAFISYLTKKKVLSRAQLRYCVLRYYWHLLRRNSLLHLHRQIFNRIFRGVSLSELEEQITPFLEGHLEEMFHHPTITLLEESLAKGDLVYILSSSPSFLVNPIAKRLGVDKVIATEYAVDPDECLYDIAMLIDGNAKAQILNRMEGVDIIAYSDSIVDLPFLEAATTPVAVNPDRHLKKMAHRKRWEIME